MFLQSAGELAFTFQRIHSDVSKVGMHACLQITACCTHDEQRSQEGSQQLELPTA